MGHPKDRAAALDFRAVLIGADNASGAAGVSTLRGPGRGCKSRLGLVAGLVTGLALDLPPNLALPLAHNLREHDVQFPVRHEPLFAARPQGVEGPRYCQSVCHQSTGKYHALIAELSLSRDLWPSSVLAWKTTLWPRSQGCRGARGFQLPHDMSAGARAHPPTTVTCVDELLVVVDELNSGSR